MADCKYGDPTCPCQDGDMCHYKAGWKTPAMPVPAEYVDAALAKKDTEIELLRATIEEISADPGGDYYFGLRCGVEDRDIHDRYEAVEYGWEQAFEYIASIAAPERAEKKPQSTA